MLSSLNYRASIHQHNIKIMHANRAASYKQINQSCNLRSILLVLLAAKPGKLVCDRNVKLCSTLHNLLALTGRDVVGDFSTVCPVVHHKQLQIRDIVHHKLLELVGKVVPGLLVRTITNVGHQGASLELPPNTGVNTLWPAPAWLQCRQTKISYFKHESA
jgi:hypothetical protein